MRVIKQTSEPQPIVEEDSPAKEARLRAACIQEIIDTEESYLEDLKVLEEVTITVLSSLTIFKVFYTPIVNSKILKDEEITRLFSNIRMLPPVHKEGTMLG